MDPRRGRAIFCRSDKMIKNIKKILLLQGLCGIFTFVSVLFCGDTQDKLGVLIRLACRRGSLLKFRGLLIMRTITAATAFPVPLCGISSLLSAHSASSAVFRDTENLMFKAWIFCALRTGINPILQPRNPAMDHCGCLRFAVEF